MLTLRYLLGCCGLRCQLLLPSHAMMPCYAASVADIIDAAIDCRQPPLRFRWLISLIRFCFTSFFAYRSRRHY